MPVNRYQSLIWLYNLYTLKPFYEYFHAVKTMFKIAVMWGNS